MKYSVSTLYCFVAVFIIFSCDYKPKNQGQSLYSEHCEGCHMEAGEGLGRVIPPLANADFIQSHIDELPCLIRNGLNGRIVVNGHEYNGEMKGFSQLTDVEINNLIYYIQKEINGLDLKPNINQVREALKNCD